MYILLCVYFTKAILKRKKNTVVICTKSDVLIKILPNSERLSKHLFVLSSFKFHAVTRHKAFSFCRFSFKHHTYDKVLYRFTYLALKHRTKLHSLYQSICWENCCSVLTETMFRIAHYGTVSIVCILCILCKCLHGINGWHATFAKMRSVVYNQSTLDGPLPPQCFVLDLT